MNFTLPYNDSELDLLDGRPDKFPRLLFNRSPEVKQIYRTAFLKSCFCLPCYSIITFDSDKLSEQHLPSSTHLKRNIHLTHTLFTSVLWDKEAPLAFCPHQIWRSRLATNKRLGIQVFFPKTLKDRGKRKEMIIKYK